MRHAAICPHLDKTTGAPCGQREFLDTREQAETWRCPTHGKGVVQENRPYFGRDTRPPAARTP